MPDTTPQTIGAFSEYAARLTRHGDVRYSDAGTPDSLTDTWTVYVPDTEARLDLANVDNLPKIGDKHPANDSLALVGYRVREHGPGELFRQIDCEYSSAGETETEGGGDQPEEVGRVTALDWPAYTASGDLVTDQTTGAPVVNSAGDVFDSVPQYEETWIGVHFVRRVKEWPAEIIAIAGTVNDSAITIYGVTFNARAARLRVGCRYLFDGSERPYELDITVEPRHNKIDKTAATLRPANAENDYTITGTVVDLGWDVAILDCGFQYKETDGGSSRLVRFTVVDETGATSAPQLPQLLTADGGDGRDASHKSMLIVKTAPGNAWTALKAPSTAPGQTPPPNTGD